MTTNVHLSFPHTDWEIEVEQVPRLGEHVFWNVPGDTDATWLVTQVVWSVNPDSVTTTALLTLEPASPDAQRLTAEPRTT